MAIQRAIMVSAAVVGITMGSAASISTVAKAADYPIGGFEQCDDCDGYAHRDFGWRHHWRGYAERERIIERPPVIEHRTVVERETIIERPAIIERKVIVQHPIIERRVVVERPSVIERRAVIVHRAPRVTIVPGYDCDC